MSKKLSNLYVSLDSERHVYTWKQLGTPSMIFLWLMLGVIWLSFLYSWRDFRWNIFNLYFLGWMILWVISLLYQLVLRTSVEVCSDKLSTTKTPLNWFAKDLKLEEIVQVYYEKSMLEKYCVKAELKKGKNVKLLFNLKEEQAIELAQHIDNSRKHFQKVRMISTGKGINDF